MANNKAIYLYVYVFILIFKEATALRSQKIRPSDDTIEQIESLKERILATDNLRPKSLAAEQDPELSFRIGLGMLSPLPIDVDDELLKNIDSQKAFACSQLQCSRQETSTPVCACNYKSGNVVTFKNDCDAKKHNCRFNTDFHVILNEICPWEFVSRRDSKELNINYDDPKYYN
ncbi:PREDICTED: uncharacterized protein LOC106122041 [Papilio xuthus]|uniref:Uncharacterized protein LOC106122041 n=1 Tax=Papilio xuthus TaxID=66420 RepID=A0AAJ7EDW4_PAPXU|nr:PREDICTED: uncharacterized protein LOC106122041 [Papilio xuthus]